MKKDDIPWDVIIPELVKVATPFIQAIAWIGLTKVDPKINAMNNLIAIGEIVPAVDLGLPKGVVLGALYDKTGDALEMLNQIAQALGDLPGELKEFIQEQTDLAKEEVEKFLKPVEEAKEPAWWVKSIYDIFGAGVEPGKQ
jgi:hypothetical protein